MALARPGAHTPSHAVDADAVLGLDGEAEDSDREFAMTDQTRPTVREKRIMLRPDTKQYGFSALANTAALVAVAVALVCNGGSALAQEPQRAPSAQPAHLVSVRLADLEDAFWICDYTATTRRAPAADIATCSAIYDALKERKFGGDFDKLLYWWQQNKVAQHERLGAVDDLQEVR